MRDRPSEQLTWMRGVREWRLTIGAHPGYNGNLEPERVASQVAEVFNTAAAEIREQSGIVISAVQTSALALYPRDFGCPTGGEHVVVLNGNPNPKFMSSDTRERERETDAYECAITDLCLRMQRALAQSTIRLTWTALDTFAYSEMSHPCSP